MEHGFGYVIIRSLFTAYSIYSRGAIGRFLRSNCADSQLRSMTCSSPAWGMADLRHSELSEEGTGGLGFRGLGFGFTRCKKG